MVVLHCLLLCDIFCFFFFSSRRRHTRCALVTGVQTCALPIFRLVLMTGHYRQPVDWNDEVVAESRKKLDRLYGALRELADVEPAPGATAPDAFIAALEDDINTPMALAELFELARPPNKAQDANARTEEQTAEPPSLNSTS